jgi:hypothetical protein
MNNYSRRCINMHHAWWLCQHKNRVLLRKFERPRRPADWVLTAHLTTEPQCAFFDSTYHSGERAAANGESCMFLWAKLAPPTRPRARLSWLTRSGSEADPSRRGPFASSGSRDSGWALVVYAGSSSRAPSQSAGLECRCRLLVRWSPRTPWHRSRRFACSATSSRGHANLS